MSSSIPHARSPRLSWLDRLLMTLEREGNRRLRRLGTALFRLMRGRIGPRKRAVLLLTTRGRTSGREHTVLLQGFPDGDTMILVAANSGRSSDPDWFKNLLATPTARIEIKGRTLPVRAERVTPEEATICWSRILLHAPSYARYQQATDRVIPLVRLVPAGSDGASP
jgi:F420H(2)-dependent quinone reductase